MAKGDTITPSEIGKHAHLVKAAQMELTATDVLVCGNCRNVFHLVEQFQLHKQKPCHRSVLSSSDSKPKIWAYLLWKQAQLDKDIHLQNANSWSLYQKWVKMDDSTRDTWIVAGKTVQHFSKISGAPLSEMPVKITKTVVNTRPVAEQAVRKTLMPVSNANTSIRTVTFARSVERSAGDENNEQAVASSNTQTLKRKLPTHQDAPKAGRYGIRKDPITNKHNEEIVEKVVAKRLNNRKAYEYLVKWEGRPYEENTWETLAHLEKVPQLLQKFEKQLTAQKEAKALQAKEEAKQENKTDTNKLLSTNSLSKLTRLDSIDASDAKKLSSGIEISTRPARTSKTKAMDVVKQWVQESNEQHRRDLEEDWLTNLSHNSSGASTSSHNTSFRNKQSAPTLEEVVSTTNTMEDLEDDLIPSHTLKRMNNGNTISVEVKSKLDKTHESKTIKVSGRNSTVEINSPNCAKLILTEVGSNINSCVKRVNTDEPLPEKKPRLEAQVRMLTQAEAVVMNSGVVKLSNYNSASNNINIGDPQYSKQHTTTNANLQPRSSTSLSTRSSVTVIRRESLPTLNTNSTTTVNRSVGAATTAPDATNMLPRTTSGGALIQRKVFTPPHSNTTTITPTLNSFMQDNSRPASGRMIIPRSASSSNSTRQNFYKNVTPEQKILQLSKSGDLKVTKKVITHEEAQRLPSQREQQTVLSQVQHQQQQQEEAQQELLSQQQQLLQALLQQEIQNSESKVEDPGFLFSSDHHLLTGDDNTPVLITGEDGTVYQVAGKNAEGQTILVTQGPDGEQQFAYVSTTDSEDGQVLTLDNAVAEAVAQLPADQQAEALAAAVNAADGQQKYLVKTTQEDGTTQLVTMTESELTQHQAIISQQEQLQEATPTALPTEQLCIQADGVDGQDGSNIPAEIIQADLPSPGGTRRVVLMLQDGTLMMTEMEEDQFNALNLSATMQE